MTSDGRVEDADQVRAHDGLLWKAKPDATATFDQFLEAREQFLSIHEQASWNPWLLDDHATEIDQWIATMDQWVRAEPGFKPMTKQELEAEWALRDEQLKEQRAEEDKRRDARRERYDPALEEARLALLEQEAVLAHVQQELAELQDGVSFPAMPADRRANQIAAGVADVASRSVEVDRLRELVGDPETIVDSAGRLPDDRRELSLTLFSIWRTEEVKQLRASIAELSATLDATKGRSERAEIRRQLDPKKQRLSWLVAVPPMTSADMCADCARPMTWHGYKQVGVAQTSPCPAWPNWAARIKAAREMLLAASARAKTTEVVEAAVKPTPIAVVPSRLPISEVIERLRAVANKHPDAIVRRGNANRWEIWRPTDV